VQRVKNVLKTCIVAWILITLLLPVASTQTTTIPTTTSTPTPSLAKNIINVQMIIFNSSSFFNVKWIILRPTNIEHSTFNILMYIEEKGLTRGDVTFVNIESLLNNIYSTINEKGKPIGEVRGEREIEISVLYTNGEYYKFTLYNSGSCSIEWNNIIYYYEVPKELIDYLKDSIRILTFIARTPALEGIAVQREGVGEPIKTVTVIRTVTVTVTTFKAGMLKLRPPINTYVNEVYSTIESNIAKMIDVNRLNNSLWSYFFQHYSLNLTSYNRLNAWVYLYNVTDMEIKGYARFEAFHKVETGLKEVKPVLDGWEAKVNINLKNGSIKVYELTKVYTGIYDSWVKVDPNYLKMIIEKVNTHNLVRNFIDTHRDWSVRETPTAHWVSIKDHVVSIRYVFRRSDESGGVVEEILTIIYDIPKDSILGYKVECAIYRFATLKTITTPTTTKIVSVTPTTTARSLKSASVEAIPSITTAKDYMERLDITYVRNVSLMLLCGLILSVITFIIVRRVFR